MHMLKPATLKATVVQPGNEHVLHSSPQKHTACQQSYCSLVELLGQKQLPVASPAS